VVSPLDPRSPRLRELGLAVGALPAGPANAITDVPGVTVGHVTVLRDEPEPPEGRGVARTGVTVVAPPAHGTLKAAPAAAGAAVLNGAGELTGVLELFEWGTLQTPVYLTSTMQVGRIYDGAVAAAVAADPEIGVSRVVIPVVGECDDSWLSESRVPQVEPADAGHALAAARPGPVEEGCVGAGTGMLTLGWKGGIGTASRVVDPVEATLGVLVLSNFGTADQLRIDGVAAGGVLGSGVDRPPGPAGSCIAVVATDAPLSSAQLERVARRCGLGLARTGSIAHHGSGEIFVAFSTTARATLNDRNARRGFEGVPDGALDWLFQATVDATEEAVLNALWAAVDTTGRDGRLARALPHDETLELLERHGRLDSGT
jgi:D-aminopeptidase